MSALESLAVDLGAGSGRAVLGRFDGRRAVTREVHRFANDPVLLPDGMHWDILRLYHELLQGLQQAWRACGSSGTSLSSVGIDSWAVDYGLLDQNGALLSNPYHYRDERTSGVAERLYETFPKRRIFERTGIQMLPFNTLYQLAAEVEKGSPAFRNAASLLLIPDLLGYFLTGERVTEWTNATTTQLVNARTGDWDDALLSHIGAARELFTSIVQPGTVVGPIRQQISSGLGLGPMPVIAVAEHDTASAVVSVPSIGDRPFAYLSCGTWSLLGTELPHPHIDDQAFAANFTNEGGVGRTARFLKNIMGLWILQECRRTWQRERPSLAFDELVQAAANTREMTVFFDPDDEEFLAPGDMPARIAAYCLRTGQTVPEGYGEVTRAVIDSLACKYAFVLKHMEAILGLRLEVIHIVGGGAQNHLLCQTTANVTGRTVLAGPTEATAIGNLAMQWIAKGEIRDVAEARSMVADCWPCRTYEPDSSDRWTETYARFLRITGLESK